MIRVLMKSASTAARAAAIVAAAKLGADAANAVIERLRHRESS